MQRGRGWREVQEFESDDEEEELPPNLAERYANIRVRSPSRTELNTPVDTEREARYEEASFYRLRSPPGRTYVSGGASGSPSYVTTSAQSEPSAVHYDRIVRIGERDFHDTQFDFRTPGGRRNFAALRREVATRYGGDWGAAVDWMDIAPPVESWPEPMRRLLNTPGKSNVQRFTLFLFLWANGVEPMNAARIVMLNNPITGKEVRHMAQLIRDAYSGLLSKYSTWNIAGQIAQTAAQAQGMFRGLAGEIDAEGRLQTKRRKMYDPSSESRERARIGWEQARLRDATSRWHGPLDERITKFVNRQPGSKGLEVEREIREDLARAVEEPESEQATYAREVEEEEAERQREAEYQHFLRSQGPEFGPWEEDDQEEVDEALRWLEKDM